MSILPRIKGFTPVEEKCPLLAVARDGLTTITKGGTRARIIELDGCDTGGLDDEIIESMFQERKMAFDGLPRTIDMLYQGHRVKRSKDATDEAYSVPMAQSIGEAWGRQFRTSFKTRHFLVLTTAKGDLGDQLTTLFDKGESASDEDLRLLADASERVMEQLRAYGPRLLTGDEIATYWGWMLSGRHVQRRVGPHGLLDGVLTDTDLIWPKGKRYQVYRATRTRYSTWLIIKAPAQTTDHGFLESLYKINREMSIFQSFKGTDKNQVLKEVEDYRKNVLAWARAGDIILDELNELEMRIQADEITMIRHRFAVEVFGVSETDLENAIKEVTNTIESWSYPVARESVNQEVLFWSRFPGAHEWNPRIRSITSENAAHFAPFSTVGEGFEACSWGDAPVTLFKTPHGTEYSFVFHDSREKEALGHTLAIGGSNSGKTTLLSFLLSQCLKYPGFRALSFDRLRGMEVFTRLHDGIYMDLVDGLQTNPLQLDDTGENRMFLSRWLPMITGASDEETESVVRQLYQLPRSERTLGNIKDAFGLKREGSARAQLEKWLPGGSLGGFFSGERDSLEFDRPLVTLDMTTLLDTPEILAPLSTYLVHKMLQFGRKEGGYAIFVDELPKYLKSNFSSIIEVMLQEVRKTDGIFIGAAQSADAILDYEKAPVFLNNVATYILFPEPKAKPEHYIKGLGLTEQEFQWVKKHKGSRQALIKRREGASVVVDIDLSGIGPYLRTFASGTDAVRKMNELRSEHENWKARYLGL